MLPDLRTARIFANLVLVSLVLVCAGLTASAHADAPSGARSVTLAQAVQDPTSLAMLYPHARVTYVYDAGGSNCRAGGFFSDVSAYTARGGALSPMAWQGAHTVQVWRDVDGRSVTFDGITFRNHTHKRVIVAGWCEH